MISGSNTTVTVRYIYGNVKVEMSMDGGLTYPYLLHASYNCGEFDPEEPDRIVTIPILVPDFEGGSCYIKYTHLATGYEWLSGEFSVAESSAVSKFFPSTSFVGMALA